MLLGRIRLQPGDRKHTRIGAGEQSGQALTRPKAASCLEGEPSGTLGQAPQQGRGRGQQGRGCKLGGCPSRPRCRASPLGADRARCPHGDSVETRRSHCRTGRLSPRKTAQHRSPPPGRRPKPEQAPVGTVTPPSLEAWGTPPAQRKPGGQQATAKGLPVLVTAGVPAPGALTLPPVGRPEGRRRHRPGRRGLGRRGLGR